VTRIARERVAELVGAHSMDVIFTSCATESNNAAIAAALSHGRGAIMWPAVQEGVKKSRFGRAL